MYKYNVSEFAKMIGVSDRTLRRWDNAGMFCACRTPSGRPYYTDKHYVQYTQPDFRLNKNNSTEEQIQRLEKQFPPTAC